MKQINFTPAVIEDMAARGIVVLSARGLRAVHPEVRFEAPVGINATVRLNTPVRIGAFTHINGGVVGTVQIGRYCSIAPGVVIGQAGHPLDRISVSPLTWDTSFNGWDGFGPVMARTSSPANLRPMTSIGNDVWLGQNVIVRAGVTIGDGAVVGAGAVVVSDLKPYGIYGGVPARRIRRRFDQATTARLIASAWWRHNLIELDLDLGGDVNGILDRIEEIAPDPWSPDVWTPD
jgi:acetyltransferase-like isoleucine patch superfamily enzyme